jgi:hypothetical protein
MMINPIISTRPRSCDISQPQSQDHASQIWRHRPLPARGLTTAAAAAAAAAGPSKRSGRNFIGSGHSVSSHATARKLSRNCVPAGKRRPQTVAAPPIPRRFTCGVIRRTSSQKRREISGQARDSCRSIPALKKRREISVKPGSSRSFTCGTTGWRRSDSCSTHSRYLRTGVCQSRARPL